MHSSGKLSVEKLFCKNLFWGGGEENKNVNNNFCPLKIGQYGGKCIYLVYLHGFSHKGSFKTVAGCDLAMCCSSHSLWFACYFVVAY